MNIATASSTGSRRVKSTPSSFTMVAPTMAPAERRELSRKKRPPHDHDQPSEDAEERRREKQFEGRTDVEAAHFEAVVALDASNVVWRGQPEDEHRDSAADAAHQEAPEPARGSAERGVSRQHLCIVLHARGVQSTSGLRDFEIRHCSPRGNYNRYLRISKPRRRGSANGSTLIRSNESANTTPAALPRDLAVACRGEK
jgi:hypothetical protein